MPDRDAILKFITENPDQAGKREVARAFGLKGAQRINLKAILGELQDEGLIKKQGKRFAKPGTLPSVTVLDITARDREGGLLARPVQWDEETDGKYPVVSIINHPRSKAPAAGVGDRVLARISTPPKGSPRGRVMKVLDRNRGIDLIFVGVGDIVGALSGDEIEKGQDFVAGIQVVKRNNPLLDF